MKYFAARHGFAEWEYDKMKEGIFLRGEVAETPVTLLLTETFMNRSGEAIRKLVDFYKLNPGRHLNPNPKARRPPKVPTATFYRKASMAFPNVFLEGGRPHHPTIGFFRGLVFNGARFARTKTGGVLVLSGPQTWILRFMRADHPMRVRMQKAVDKLKERGLPVLLRKRVKESDYERAGNLVRKPGFVKKTW